MNVAHSEYLPREGEYDPLAAGDQPATVDEAVDQAKLVYPSPRMIRCYAPSELRAYVPPPHQNMVGDYHLQRGAMSVLAGPPGCGKSRATLSLAVLGAQGAGTWFGHPIHTRFRTLILQNENSLSRLHRDMLQIGDKNELDDCLRISAPPPSGLALQNPAFRAELKAKLRDFEPGLLIVDPWNACVQDSMERDFQEALLRLREVLVEVPGEPALLVVHHLRKPRGDDRHRGRSLQHLVSGSYVMSSVPRSIFIMQPASDDTEDARVVVTCAKNNDGDLGPRTAWERRDGALFVPVDSFDWISYDGGELKREPKINEQHLRELFEQGRKQLPLNKAAERLSGIAGVGRSTAYKALELSGRFGNLLIRDPDTNYLGLRSGTAQTEAEDVDGGEPS